MSTESENPTTTKNTGNGILGNNSNSTNSTTNTNERQSCKFGKQCNRKNPQHRIHVAHPGDGDYIVPKMPEPRDNAPECQYGRKCYRLNPEHFRDFRHPRNINIQNNYKTYILKKLDKMRNSDSSFDYDYSEDPFADDSGSDYNPNDDGE